jgi:hypothetical protein
VRSMLIIRFTFVLNLAALFLSENPRNLSADDAIFIIYQCYDRGSV